MFVDTDAIRALGSAHTTHADDLAGIAASLTSLPTGSAVFGPIGARFVAGLATAAAEASHVVAALSHRLSTSTGTAYAAAAAYEDTDSGIGTRIAEV
jgi:hypothetical protein